MARICERGLFDSIFFADTNGVHDVYQESPRAAIERAAPPPIDAVATPAQAGQRVDRFLAEAAGLLRTDPEHVGEAIERLLERQPAAEKALEQARTILARLFSLCALSCEDALPIRAAVGV